MRRLCDRLGLPRGMAIWSLLVGLWLLAIPARAATLFILDDTAKNNLAEPFFTPVCNAKLAGQILAGDASRIRARLSEFYDRVQKKGRPEAARSNSSEGYFALCLASDGGDIAEAMEIAKLFRSWMRVVDAGDKCISACAVLFMNVGRRDGVLAYFYTEPGRYLHYRGKLGFHAPSLVFAKDAAGNLRPEMVEQAYDRALRTIRDIVYHRHAGAAAQAAANPAGNSSQETPGGEFSAVGVLPDTSFIPPDLMFAFLAVPPSQVYYIDRVEQALLWGIEVYGFEPPRQITERMLFTACINVAHARCLYGGDDFRCMTKAQARDLRPPVLSGTKTLLWSFFQNTMAQYKFKRVAPQTVASEPGAIALLGVRVEGPVGIQIGAKPQIQALCAAILGFENRRLVSLKLFTFNGQGGGQLLDERFPVELNAGQSVLLEIKRTRRMDLNSLRPWKMLLAHMRLDELGRNPWAVLEQGNVIAPP